MSNVLSFLARSLKEAGKACCILAFALSSDAICGPGQQYTFFNPPADPQADSSTTHVFWNLQYLVSKGHFIFGQEFPTDFQWATEDILDRNFDDSDCKDVVGQHPGVFGSDFHYFLELTSEQRAIHLQSVKAAHDRGALITFDWHLSSPRDRGGSFYVNDGNRHLLEEITAGINDDGDCDTRKKSMCRWYFNEVDKVIDIMRELSFPIAFRPLHEMTGFWFWWGNPRKLNRGNTRYLEFAHRYVKLYRALVKYTRSKGIHHLLYVWSPSDEANFDFYPGDEWVDIVGLDVYEQGTVYGRSIEYFKNEVGRLTEFAQAHGKVAVLAETGFRMGYPEIETNFWTDKVLSPLMRGSRRFPVAWILSWMNAQWERNPYIPYGSMQNQNAVLDFERFFQARESLFEGDFSGIETSDFVIHK